MFFFPRGLLLSILILEIISRVLLLFEVGGSTNITNHGNLSFNKTLKNGLNEDIFN